MNIITEGNLTFSFESGCQISQYGQWSFFKNQFNYVALGSKGGSGSKGVDIVCVDRDYSWLIEVKDYRQYPRKKTIDILEETAKKVRDTLAGLVAAAKLANDADERDFAKKALVHRRRWRVVLHLEQIKRKPIIPGDLSSHLRKKELLKAIDAHPMVCDRSITNANKKIPWKVESRAVQ